MNLSDISFASVAQHINVLFSENLHGTKFMFDVSVRLSNANRKV